MSEFSGYTLFAVKGAGSAIVEALLTLAGATFSLTELTYDKLGPGSGPLQKLNPLGQVPTLLLPDGEAMTESAAITLHLAEQFPAARLAPLTDSPVRSQFLRWLVFLGSPVYATFTYGDEPERWVPESSIARTLRQTTDTHREMLWRCLDRQISPAPWLLGEEFSALDIFICTMTRWRPRRNWFAEHCPNLHSIARAADDDPRLSAVWARNFP